MAAARVRESVSRLVGASRQNPLGGDYEKLIETLPIGTYKFDGCRLREDSLFKAIQLSSTWDNKTT